MQISHGISGLKALPQRAVVSVGNFDGIHLGHRAILAESRRIAGGGPLAVVTFEPHPLTVLRPQYAPPRLSTVARKERLLAEQGVTHLVILAPEREVLDLSAEDFFAILRDDIAAAHLVEGSSFTFGKGRGGTIDRLRAWTAGTATELHVIDGVEAALLDLTLIQVSSSILRWLLLRGRVRDAAIGLGRPDALEGPVVEGFKRGRQIGFPTANLHLADQLIPADGVYAGRCALEGVDYLAAVSIGTMPTFEGKNPRQVEAHLLDFTGDLYGKTIAVDLLDWLRDQWKMPSVGVLKHRLARDVAQTRRLLFPTAPASL